MCKRSRIHAFNLLDPLVVVANIYNDSPVSNVLLHWWPRRDSNWLCHPSSVGASLGFTPTMWTADLITWLPRFHSTPCRSSSSSSQYSYRLEPRSNCWVGALWISGNFTSPHILTGPVGQPFASHLGGQRCASRECTHTYNGTRFAC